MPNAERMETAGLVVSLALAHLDADIERSPNKEIRVTKAEIDAFEAEHASTRLDLDVDDATEEIIVRKTRVGRAI